MRIGICERIFWGVTILSNFTSWGFS